MIVDRLNSMGVWLWRIPLLLALVAGLAIVPAAGAQVGPSTITLLAPGAPAGAWVDVQWQGAAGNWHHVDGWQGTIEIPPVAGHPFKQWVVFSDQFGRGPFRWVVYTQQGGPVWATSPSFTLPDRPATDVVLTVTAAAMPAPAPPATPPAQPPAATAVFASDELACRPLFCGFSLLTARTRGAPAGAWIGVQWLDTLGTWQDVEGWQGNLDMPVAGLPFKQWVVLPEQYGRGPFRWVVYTQPGGSIWATSPNFQLPADGIELTVTISR
jgi:hypothetical protein